MTTDNLVRYPAGPGQFLSMLERTGQIGNWHITHAPAPFGGRTFTSFGITADAGTLPNDAALVYVGDDLPLVKLDAMRFDLMRLFEPRAEWHPSAYSANSFMPWRLKDFLDQLFAVLMLDRTMRARAMTLAA
jgi:hypothetical protein